MMSGPPRVTLYGRAACHLCESARLLLERLAPELGFEIDEIDIDAEPELIARYDLVVPVIAVGEREVARAPIDEQAVARRLATALRTA
jgi:glutaredoxin